MTSTMSMDQVAHLEVAGGMYPDSFPPSHNIIITFVGDKPKKINIDG